MSGYTRGGVQLSGFRAAPAVLPNAASTAQNSSNAYATYTNGTTHYPSTSNTGYQAVQYQSYGGQYGGAYASGAGFGSGYSNSLQATQRMPSTVNDDYERWYTENAPNNRMLLALRSGIDSEVAWALDRLCRLCTNELFTLAGIPGLLDALFEWPEWFIDEHGHEPLQPAEVVPIRTDGTTHIDGLMFRPSRPAERHRRHALESLLIMRTAAVTETNAVQLAAHSKTRKLIVRALTELDTSSDETTEFLLNVIDILQSIAGSIVLPIKSSTQNSDLAKLVPALEKLTGESNNRTVIITSLTALTSLFNNPQNAAHTTASSKALDASIRYLPLFQDVTLVDACVNFLYSHLAYPPMTKAFLMHPDMSATLKLLVGLIISQQDGETTVKDITGPRHMAPVVKVKSIPYELVGAELTRIGSLPETQRCFEWMKTMFVSDPEGELTQVEFWSAYKELFSPFQDRSPLLVASDVIKNVSIVFPQAQAMVLPGPPQRFVIHGINRKKEVIAADPYVCQWDRSQCAEAPFGSPDALRAHIETHLSALSGENEDFACSWTMCKASAPSLSALKPHIWTHISLKSNSTNKSTQVPTVTFASTSEQHLMADPTQRLPPPPPSTTITYPAPARDPPSCSLTALLVIRTLFRASFASSDAAPRADADHFGFPGIVEESEDQDRVEAESAECEEEEGERRGRRAFVGVRHLMESVHVRDPTLMSWINEMVDSGISGTN